MNRLLPAAALATLVILIPGCGPDPVSNAAPTPTPTPTPAPLAEYTACTSIAPVDAGNPNQSVITLLGARVVNQPLGAPYTDAGATATDPAGGDLTSRITVSGLADVNTNAVGDYLIRYSVTNSAQLVAVEVSRLVRVNAGTFAELTPRDIGSTGAHLAYYEHLPVNYNADPNQRFPLLVYQHGRTGARFADPYTVQRPLSGLLNWGISGLIEARQWDDSRPFIVLSPQRCVDPWTPVLTAYTTKLFIDYAIRTYNVDITRIYLGGHSMGSVDTWDYVANYPHQLAAVVPLSDGYGTAAGCVLGQTPSWSFIGQDDPLVPYQSHIDTVNSINACNPAERAKITVFPGVQHVDIEPHVWALTSLGAGLPQYDLYDQSIFDWLLQHRRTTAGSAAISAEHRAEPRAAAAAPSEALSLSPASIAYGRSATLKWSVAGATSCVASGGWVGPRPATGSESVTPPAPGTYGYVLGCTGPAGPVAYSATLEVRTTAVPQ